MNVLIFFNTPYLGGAERSMLYQAKNLAGQMRFVIPVIDGVVTKELEAEIKNMYPSSEIISLDFPIALYEVSRQNTKKSILILIIAFLEIFISLRKIKFLANQKIWINGNKIGFPILLYLIVCNFKGDLVWHFRDYIFNSGVFRVIWKLLGSNLGANQKIIIGNSNSVTENCKEVLNNSNIFFQTIYNPVGKLNRRANKRQSIKNIGLVAMFTPWKGIHFVMNFEKIYRRELIRLGIESISIYGADIYQTKGSHNSYEGQIKKIYEENSLVKFRGRKAPEEIYEDIDLLIHSSLEPEPFGRVIIEAFHKEVPVLSTGVGGSGELVTDGVSGVRIIPYDYQLLFQKIDEIKNNQELRMTIVDGGSKRLYEVTKQQERAWELVNQQLKRDL